MELSNEELYNVVGGGKLLYGLIAAVGALVSLVVGIVDGYLRPLKCNR